MTTPTTRAVLLRHDVPGAGAHLDWLIERPASRLEHRLIAFRLATGSPPAPLDPRAGVVPAHRLPDHRAAYLDYEGPVSGGRGLVVRLADGQAFVRVEAEGHLEFEWGVPRPAGGWIGRRCVAFRREGEVWEISLGEFSPEQG